MRRSQPHVSACSGLVKLVIVVAMLLGFAGGGCAKASNTTTVGADGSLAASDLQRLPGPYDSLWSASMPMRITVAQQRARGAIVVAHRYMDSLWNQGIAENGTAAQIPIYEARSTDPLVEIDCRLYGGGCNAKHLVVHLPAYAQPQTCPGSSTCDAHLTVIDRAAPGGPTEIDCWQTRLSPGSMSCSWAGAFPLGGTGEDRGGEAVHIGRPVASYFLTGREILRGHIDHALGINAACLNDPPVYPAQTLTRTDQPCENGGADPPHYGNLIHLLWSPNQIASSPYSAPCKTILTALSTYGAYLDDTGDNGNQLRVENEVSYLQDPQLRGIDPWPLIQSELNAAGDGSGTTWKSCLNRLTSDDFEMLQIAKPRGRHQP